MPPASCPDCGARLGPNDVICPLCGADTEEAARAETLPAAVAAGPAPGALTCPTCGTAHPADARFCMNCGAAVGSAVDPAAPVPTSAVPAARPAGAKRPGLIALGVGALVVAALFGIDRMGDDGAPPPAVSVSGGETLQQPAAAAEEPALSAEAAADAERLRAEIAAAPGEGTGPVALSKRIELVQLLATSGRLVDASEEQAKLAEITNTAPAWANAGSLLFDRMLNIPETDRGPLAEQASEYYARSLAVAPDPDVRANRAWALQYGANPMEAVLEMRAVVEEHPDHAVANYNFGLMQLKIGRTDRAIELFEKAVAVSDHDDPVHRRAEEELARIRSAAG